MFEIDGMIELALVAQTDSVALLPSLFVGLATAAFMYWLFAAMTTDDLEQEDEWRYDISRINQLRKRDIMFRLLQIPIQSLARVNRNTFPRQLPEIHRQILASGLPRYWLAEEYLARMQLISIMLLPVYAYLCFMFVGPSGVALAIPMTFLTYWYLRRSLARRAYKRIVEIKRRMPFLLDLLTLLMEAGASFIQSLGQAVSEFSGHPIADEFGRVLTDMNMGKARTEAFDGMRQRLDDEEINSIVGSILQSEQLGTPISDIFRTQADVLRVKRTQRAEKIAGEAGVNMLLPGILVMASTVLIILGPFILSYMISGIGI